MSGIYVASKTKHAHVWKRYRDLDFPIVSTWIDEAGEGETTDLSDLWIRCIREASECGLLIAYIEEGEVFKGGYIEIGAALGNNRHVYLVGDFPGTFMNHPLVTKYSSLEEAFDNAYTYEVLG